MLLASGLIEIKYNTGARVVVEGPAEFTILGKKNGYLKFGKLVARVEGRKAKGFAIDTPVGRVEDLGTEFGVEVKQDGATRVHTFEGLVVVSDSAGGQTVEVRSDEFVEVEPKREHITFGDVAP